MLKSDLVIEYAEQIYNSSEHKNRQIPGVHISEWQKDSSDIHVTEVKIISEEGVHLIGKPQGTYVTIEAARLNQSDDQYHRQVTEVIMDELLKLVPNVASKKILIAGIGNRDITSDALGPLVVEHIFITRHLIKKYGHEHAIVKGMGNVSGLIPGVMAQTGMETYEMIHGIVNETKPEVLIAIDALAARNVRRLMTTIQLTDTGLQPGAGIGNHRYRLSQSELGIPVIAIGIPTVIDAATIVTDTVESMIQVIRKNDEMKQMLNWFDAFEREDNYLLLRELMEPQMKNMFVTPKDIDESVSRVSFTISEAINALCHQI